MPSSFRQQNQTKQTLLEVKTYFSTSGSLILMIVLSVIGLPLGTNFLVTNTKTPVAMTAPMPNLDGDKAKEYLEKQGLYSSLSEAISAARYNVNRVSRSPVANETSALEAQNSAQSLNAYFNEDAVYFVPRNKEEKWQFSVKLKSYGYGFEQCSVISGQWSADKTRVSVSHQAKSGIGIVEWYENKPEGLEQGFIVNESPKSQVPSPKSQVPSPKSQVESSKFKVQSSRDEDQPLRLVLKVDGDLKAKIAGDGQSLMFVKGNKGASVLHYDKLKSWDANGKELVSRMAVDDDELSLVVDDREAVYPITIDPTFTQVKKITASDGDANDLFGISVAISGNRAIIGALGDEVAGNPLQGSAYIFERNQGGANNWGEVKKLIASDGMAGDAFGATVSISGDMVIVGASGAVFNVVQGSAYIFERNQGGANNWGEVKKLTASDFEEGDHFGLSVGISGDSAVVGMNNLIFNPKGSGTSTPGAAYIFERNAGGTDNWGEVKIITSPLPQNFDGFGSAVAISGDTIIAVGKDDVSSLKAVYVFERDEGASGWGQIKKLKASDGAANDFFGATVAISGDTIIVGATGADVGANPDQGAAYIFERNQGGANNWSEVKKLTANDGDVGDAFGVVAIDNNRVVVAAQHDDIGSNADQGSAYIFEQNQGGANNWGQVKKIVASDGVANKIFGSVGISDKTVIVGLGNGDVGANLFQGSAYFFVSQNDAWIQDIKPLPANCTVDDAFGSSVAINGDTAIVGAPSGDVGVNANQGVAFIFERNQGGTNNWGLVKTVSASDGAAEDNFGNSVAISTNTVIVGAFQDDVGANTNQGSAYIFERNQGGANNWGEVKKLIASDGAGNDRFGLKVAIDTDTAIVAAANDDIGAKSDQGSAHIFERNTGGANNWGVVKQLIASDGMALDFFASSVSISGDMVVAGAAGDDVGSNSNQGSAYVFGRNSGGANNWGFIKKLMASDGAINDFFGGAISISGNTVVASARSTIGGNIQQGSAYIFERNTGGADNWGEVKKLIASDGATLDLFSISVAISGDTVIVGAFQDDVGANTNQGSAYIFERNQGGANNWGEVKKLIASDGAAYDAFGISVAITNDTVIVGASGNDDAGVIGQGSSYIFVNQGADWIQQAKPVPPPPANCGVGFDGYGFSVAISGDTAVIGSPYDDIGINVDQGSAYVLERNQGGANKWGLVKLLLASDGMGSGSFGDNFGVSVAISGNTIVVGANQATVGANFSQGAAYIFERNNGGTNNWGEAKKVTASDGAVSDWFGLSVAISNNSVIIGAPLKNVGANNFQGAAYIFERNSGGANNWGEVKKLTASDGAANDAFGRVAISGNTAVVGADFANIVSNNEGAVYVFERNNGGTNNWGEAKKLTASDGAADDRFGAGVSISGNSIIVGAFKDDVGGRIDQGSAYIFERNNGGTNNWGEAKKLTAIDGAADDFFGLSVSISGDTVIVGAANDDIGANQNQGSAYIFEQNVGGANNWGQAVKLVANDGATGDFFGYSVAVDGDNFLIGAYLANISSPFTDKSNNNSFGGGTNQGAGYVFRGVVSGPTAASVAVSGRITTALGTGVSSARVILTNHSGETRTVLTNQFGYYRFDNVSAGEAYIFSVSHKRYMFMPQFLTVTEETNNLNFTADN